MTPPSPSGSRKFAAIAGAAVLAAGLSACGTPDDVANDQYLQVCQDVETGERVEDDRCDDVDDNSNSSASNAFLWYWLLRNSSSPVPAVGQNLTSYQGSKFTSKPTNGEIYKGVSPQGGSFDSAVKGATSTKVGSAAGNSSGKSGGFGSGSKSGGGTSGG